MLEKYIIFGAGSGGIKVFNLLRNMQIDISFFVDNDTKKQGTIIEEKKVKHPSSILDHLDHKIIIASYNNGIKNQLTDMGITDEYIIVKEKLILQHLNDNLNTFEKPVLTNPASNDKQILIELAEGLKLGGLERWVLTISKLLTERNRRVTIFSQNINPEEKAENMPNPKNMVLFDFNEKNYIQLIKNISEELINYLPCSIIINRFNPFFFAAYLIKQWYPEHINIISVIHADFDGFYEQNIFLEQGIDTFLCVSDDVMENFITKYNAPAKKVLFLDHPISVDRSYIKKYSTNNKPVIIGYGARLERVQKRVDLIPLLLEKLEATDINYELHIAGNGSYFNFISDFIKEKNLANKVKLYGYIPFEEMSNFWSSCDLFLNLSDFEGIGLSLLESMSYGVVPIVTNTAGAKSFIKNDYNGYVLDVGDLDGIVQSICILGQNRESLTTFGNRCIEIIDERCNPLNYCSELISILERN